MCFEQVLQDLIPEDEISVSFEKMFGLEHNSTPMPERALLSAILENAIRDAWRAPVPGASCPHKQAMQWLHITSPLEPEDLEDPIPFTFVWIAEELGFDAKELHKKIVRNTKKVRLFKLEQRRIR